MDGNDEAFVDTPQDAIQLVLSNPQLLYFDTNWWEENYQGIVALKLQGIALYHNYLFQTYLFFKFLYYISTRHRSGIKTEHL